jgi:hypothetical protein
MTEVNGDTPLIAPTDWQWNAGLERGDELMSGPDGALWDRHAWGVRQRVGDERGMR